MQETPQGRRVSCHLPPGPGQPFLPWLLSSVPEAVAAQAALCSNPVDPAPKAAGSPQAPRGSEQRPQLAFQEGRSIGGIPGASPKAASIPWYRVGLPSPGRCLREDTQDGPRFVVLLTWDLGHHLLF